MIKCNFENSVTPNRTVVLGGKGFVGTAVVKKLSELDASVVALGRQDLDLLSPGAADTLMGVITPQDSVVVISAEAPVKNNAMLERNIQMMSVICEALSAIPPAHVVYVSSDAVYADSDKPLTEQSCAQPDSLHGVMHLAREIMLKNAYDGPMAFLRPTLIYGIDDPHNGYGPNRFLRLADEAKEIILFGEGEERRDHVLVDDAADLLVRILHHRCEGTLNAATGIVTSFREIAEIVSAQFDEASAVKGSQRQGAMPHNGYRAFDPSLTLSVFPDFKYTPLREGLEKVQHEMTK